MREGETLQLVKIDRRRFELRSGETAVGTLERRGGWFGGKTSIEVDGDRWELDPDWRGGVKVRDTLRGNEVARVERRLRGPMTFALAGGDRLGWRRAGWQGAYTLREPGGSASLFRFEPRSPIRRSRPLALVLVEGGASRPDASFLALLGCYLVRRQQAAAAAASG